MAKSILFRVMISALTILIELSSICAEEPAAATIKVKTGSYTSSSTGGLRSTSNALSVISITDFIDGRTIGLLFSGINQPADQQRVAYVILVKHKFKDLEESTDFPSRLQNDGKTAIATQEIKRDGRKFRIKYTVERKPDGTVSEVFQSGDSQFDLAAGRVFMVDYTLQSPKLTQAAQDLGKDFACPDPKSGFATSAARETFIKSILESASKIESLQTFMEMENLAEEK